MRSRERAQARPTDPCRPAAALEVGTEGAEAGDRRQDIFTFGKTVDPAFTLCQRGQHQCPVGNRLIARDGQFTGNARRR
jgi:hypothetical protein